MNGHEFSAANTRITSDGRRQCRACQRARKEKFLAANPGYDEAWWEANRVKQREYAQNWRKNNPEALRGYVLKKMYGITLKEYNEWLEYQGHVCAICGLEESVIRRNKISALAVDHDHETGEIRGLLCQRCNMALGLLGDDVEVLKNTIKYLEEA